MAPREVKFSVSYDPAEAAPECAGWRAYVDHDGDYEIGGKDIYGPGFATMAEAVAACERWAAQRRYSLRDLSHTLTALRVPIGEAG